MDATVASGRLALAVPFPVRIPNKQSAIVLAVTKLQKLPESYFWMNCVAHVKRDLNCNGHLPHCFSDRLTCRLENVRINRVKEMVLCCFHPFSNQGRILSGSNKRRK